MRLRLNHQPISAGGLIIALMLVLSVLGHGGQLAVIELKHRPADDIIPVITPFLGPEDTLSGRDFLLFLNTTPENLTRIQSIVAHLDRAAQQLAITVVQGEDALETLGALAISGKVTLGDQVTVGVGDPRGQPDDSINVDAQNSHSTRRSSDIQRVLVQDGESATIYVGLSAPVAMGSLRHQGMTYHQVHEYRQMLTGILVTPRTSGKRITLEIETRRDQPSGGGSTAAHSQRIQTQVQGQLDEWIEIGSTLGASDRKDAGLAQVGTSRQSSRRQVFVKVEAMHP